MGKNFIKRKKIILIIFVIFVLIVPLVASATTFYFRISSVPSEPQPSADGDHTQDVWQGRVVLHGEGYLWRMITKLGLPIETETEKVLEVAEQ